MKRIILFFVLISLCSLACSFSSLPIITTPPQPTVVDEGEGLFPTETEISQVLELPTLVVEKTPGVEPEAALIEPTKQNVTEPPTFRDLQPDFVPFDFEYKKQSMSPAYLPNFAHPEAGCNWLGVAGQIFNAEGLPEPGLVIVIEGFLAGQSIEALGFTGLAKVYGPEGYEVFLGNQALPGIFWMQVFNQSGQAVSNIIEFEMSGDCEQNLALINLYRDTTEHELYIPLITN